MISVKQKFSLEGPYEWFIRTIPGRFLTNYHVLFQMQTKNFEFRTKIMAGQIRKNGNLSLQTLQVLQTLQTLKTLQATQTLQTSQPLQTL